MKKLLVRATLRGSQVVAAVRGYAVLTVCPFDFGLLSFRLGELVMWGACQPLPTTERGPPKIFNGLQGDDLIASHNPGHLPRSRTSAMKGVLLAESQNPSVNIH